MANKSLNQIISLFQEIGDKHKQINHFYFGSLLSVMKEENVTYPLLVVDVVSAAIDNKQLGLNLIVSIADKVDKAHQNMNEVQSDTLQILNDITMTLQSDKWKVFSTVSGAQTAQRFTDGELDEVTGWALNLNLQITSQKDLCQIPFDNYSFGGTYSAGCDPVKIYEDGILVESVASGGSYSYSTAGADGTAVAKDSDLNVLSSTAIPAGTSVDIPISNSTLNVNKSDAVLISSETILAEGTSSYNVADSAVNINAVKLADVKATDSLSVTVVDSLDASVSVTLSGGNKITIPGLPAAAASHSSEFYKTGQTTSYVTGDDGDLEDGNGSTFYDLGYDNGFGGGNQARFTDTSGVDWTGAATGSLIIDWSTWDRVNNTVAVWNKGMNVNDTWVNQVAWGLVDNLTTGYSGWHLSNASEAWRCVDNEIGNYPTFFDNNATDFWTSTTYAKTTTSAFYAQTSSRLNIRGKTSAEGGRQLRYYTLTELGL